VHRFTNPALSEKVLQVYSVGDMRYVRCLGGSSLYKFVSKLHSRDGSKPSNSLIMVSVNYVRESRIEVVRSVGWSVLTSSTAFYIPLVVQSQRGLVADVSTVVPSSLPPSDVLLLQWCTRRLAS
jgi:hypothetical protein